MPGAMGGYVKVYLYFLHHYQVRPLESLSLEEASTALNMLYGELMSGLNYWSTQSILTFTSLEDGTFELSFAKEKPLPTNDVLANHNEKSVAPNKIYLQQTRPNYSTQELGIYKSQDHSISKLFYIAEQYLGRMLSPTDQQILFGLYDWLHMPLDLIEFLIEFCASNQHTNLRYIEKVALGWVDEGIVSIEQARSKVTKDKRYYKILGEMGLSSQSITSVQKEFMDKWLFTYKLSLELILEGCKRTVSQTKNPSLKYLDSILTSWHTSKVSTLEDIKKLDESHQSNLQKRALPVAKTNGKNERFTNTSSHNWDFNELEKLEQQYIERKLHGGL
jgi:DnaD/phage-associated family protein